MASGSSLSHSLSFRFLLAVCLVVVIVTMLRMIRRRWVERLARNHHGKRGTLHSTGLVLNYALGLIATGMVFHALGISLKNYTVLLGALTVGIGFGLQTIVNNFVSGVVILVERPIKVDDRVLVDDMEGNIVSIGLRATTLRTNDGVSIIIPNAHFITSTVINRSLEGQATRFKVRVPVAYDSDPRQVERVLLEVARRHSGVLKDPPPYVVFDAFGDSALEFFLWVWTRDYIPRPAVLQSELNFAIHAALKEAQIVVPFNQMDVRVRQG
jgi:small-conductance mechanosensitive channel